MPLQAFSFPLPETRFFQVGQRVYKFKIRRGNKVSGEEEMLDRGCVSEELENAVRAVLMSLDSLEPFTTQHFNIFPYRSKWERVSELRFSRGHMNLFAYPFLITLYVETTEKVLQHTVNHANEQIPQSQSKEYILSSPPPSRLASRSKRKRTEQPHEGTLSQDNLSTVYEPHPQHLQAPPYLTDSAEEMLCNSELHADSEMSFQPAPGARMQVCANKQEACERSESKNAVKEKPGLLTRLTSSALFPLSLIFSRS